MNNPQNIEFQDQFASTLLYCLYNGLIDVSDLTILTEKTYVCHEHTIRIGIIGASHFLQLSNNTHSVNVTEVFACKQPTTKSEPYFYLPLSHCLKKREILFRDHGLQYKTKIYDYDWEYGFKDLNLNKEKQHLDYLEYNFPGYKDACTVLFLDKNSQEIKLSTFHCYPNEKRVIKTETIIKIYNNEQI